MGWEAGLLQTSLGSSLSFGGLLEMSLVQWASRLPCAETPCADDPSAVATLHFVSTSSPVWPSVRPMDPPPRPHHRLLSPAQHQSQQLVTQDRTALALEVLGWGVLTRDCFHTGDSGQCLRTSVAVTPGKGRGQEPKSKSWGHQIPWPPEWWAFCREAPSATLVGAWRSQAGEGSREALACGHCVPLCLSKHTAQGLLQMPG